MSNRLLFPLPFKRQFKGPLDVDSSVDSLVELNALLTSGVRYAGMIVYVKSEDKYFRLNSTEDAWLEFESGGGSGGSLTSELTAQVGIGGIEAGTVIPSGTTIEEILTAMFSQTFFPTYVNPSLSLSVNVANTIEAGTIVPTFTYTANVNRGSILGKVDGNVWNPSMVYDYRAGDVIGTYDFDGVLTALNTTDIVDVQIEDGNNVFNVSVTLDDGPQPIDSNGDNFETPWASNTLSASKTVVGKRNTWYGVSVTPTTPTDVKTLSERLLGLVKGSKFTITIPIGATNVVFAYPAALGDVSSVKYIEGMNAEIKSVFTLTTLDIGGANDYLPIQYNIYNFTPVEPFSQEVNYEVTI